MRALLCVVSDLTFQSEVFHTEFIGVEKRTRGIETSKYPQERTSTETPLVAASERGPGLSRNNGKQLENCAIAGDSPVPVK